MAQQQTRHRPRYEVWVDTDIGPALLDVDGKTSWASKQYARRHANDAARAHGYICTVQRTDDPAPRG